MALLGCTDCLAIWLLIATSSKKMYVRGTKFNQWTLASLIIAQTLRITWYAMHHLEPTVYIVTTYRVMGQVAFFFNYLAQSMYGKSWLVLIAMTRLDNVRKTLTFVLNILDVINALICLVVSIFVGIASMEAGSDYEVYNYVNMILTGVSSLTIALVYLVMGTSLVWRLKNFFSSCSFEIVSFAIASGVFLLTAVGRFIFQIIATTDAAIVKEAPYITFSYTLPDFLPAVTIVALLQRSYRHFVRYSHLTTEAEDQDDTYVV